MAMKIAQIASVTKKELRIEMKTETAVNLDDSVVGTGNIMYVLELCNMSEYIHEAEQRERLLVHLHLPCQAAEPHMHVSRACAGWRRELQRALRGEAA